MAFQGYSLTLDGATQLKDSYAVAASAAAQVNSAAAYYDTGAAGSFAQFAVIVDITAINVGTGQYYDLWVECSSGTAFSTTYRKATLTVGDTASIAHGSDTAANIRLVMYADNVCQTGTTADSQECLRYIRLYTNVNGASASITYTAYLVPIC
jgi:hypothetical protein